MQDTMTIKTSRISNRQSDDYVNYSLTSISQESMTLDIKDTFEAEQFINSNPSLKQYIDLKTLQKNFNFQYRSNQIWHYFGLIQNNKKHGDGILFNTSNAKLYVGTWENGMKHGQGFERFSTKAEYKGQFMNGKAEGYGEYLWPNGESYKGEWVNGMKHGKGEWIGTNGSKYNGEWRFGKVEGNGTYVSPNGDVYKGEFKNYLKHGYGEENFQNEDYYKGNYENGKPEGEGEYKWSNYSMYKGQFKNGLRHGKGIWKSQNNHYEGEYLNDKKSGYGIFKWASGNVYKGYFFNDLRQGYGEMYWNNGTVYKGYWNKGIQNGKGELIQENQEKQQGIFKENILISEIVEQTEEEELKSIEDTTNPQIQPLIRTTYKKEGFLDNKKTKYKLKTEPLNGRRFRSVGRNEFPQIKQNNRKISQTVNKNHSNDFKSIDSQLNEILSNVVTNKKTENQFERWANPKSNKSKMRPWLPSGRINKLKSYSEQF